MNEWMVWWVMMGGKRGKKEWKQSEKKWKYKQKGGNVETINQNLSILNHPILSIKTWNPNVEPILPFIHLIHPSTHHSINQSKDISPSSFAAATFFTATFVSFLYLLLISGPNPHSYRRSRNALIVFT